jgi:hypothetical protein
MAQQQTYDVWHGSRFRKLFGRRVVSPPVIAEEGAAALGTGTGCWLLPRCWSATTSRK